MVSLNFLLLARDLLYFSKACRDQSNPTLMRDQKDLVKAVFHNLDLFINAVDILRSSMDSSQL